MKILLLIIIDNKQSKYIFGKKRINTSRGRKKKKKEIKVAKFVGKKQGKPKLSCASANPCSHNLYLNYEYV